MKVCFVSSYYSKDYVRGSFLVETMREMKSIELYIAKSNSRGLKRYLETLVEVVKLRLKVNPDIYLISFRGHEIFPIIRFIALDKIVILDSLASPYHALNKEGKMGSLGKLISYIIYPLEAAILHLSNLVLTDTVLHKNFYSKTFGLNEGKITRIFVGSQSLPLDLPNYAPDTDNKSLSVFFYGSLIPLHGLSYILESARDLHTEKIQFYIVGGNKNSKYDISKFINDNKLENIHHTRWLEINDLFAKARECDISLGGPFGGTDQARRIITGKTYQFLNLGVPTIIGKVDEEVGFIDKTNCLLVEQANTKQLTDAIRWCKDNKDRLNSIGKAGKELYEKEFSTEAQKDSILNILRRYG